MKKVFMILGVFVVVVVVFFFIFLNKMTSDIKGVWESTSTEENCFTKFIFTDGPATNRGISFDETNSNSKKTYIGVHEVEGQELYVKVDNFDIEPFYMTYALNNDELSLNYTWKNEDYSCTYKHVDG